MPLHLLGVCRGEDAQRVPEPITAGAAAVRWSYVVDLVCAVIDGPSQVVKPIEHAAAIEAIHRNVCVLPMRFGTLVCDDTALQHIVRSRRIELRERLDRLQGTCEMGIRMLAEEVDESYRDEASRESPATTSPPSQYMERRRAHYRRVDAAEEIGRSTTQNVVQHLRGTFRQWRQLPSRAVRPEIRMEFLVEQSRVAEFCGRLEELGRGSASRKCTVLGPWAPYSFA